MIQFDMLGKVDLRGDDGRELSGLLRQPKRLALLAYLAAPSPGTWHRRDILLALFWPELDTARARTALRNALYVLRQSLGEDVVRSRGDEEVSIDPERLCTDLGVVWEALRDGRPDVALAHFGGELLPGLFPPDADGFQRWLDGERTRIRAAVAAAVRDLLAPLEERQAWGEAITIGRRMLEIEPDDEPLVRRVMQLHERLGDRAGALRTFEDYRTRLAADFQAEPAPETVAIVERLRAQRSASVVPRSRAPDAPAASAGVWPALPLPPRPPPRANPPASRAMSWMVGGAGFLIVLLVLLAVGLRRRTERSLGRTTPLTTSDGLQVEVAVSPNGRLVAYARGTPLRLRIMVQKLAGGAPWRLTGDSTNELMPRWSPDNDAVLYLARNGAYVTSAVAGTPRLVARGSEGDGMVRSAAWSPRGDSIAIVRNDSLLVQPLEGSGFRYVGSSPQLHSCTWSSRGEWFACVSGNWLALTPGPLFGNRAASAIVLFPSRGGDRVELTGREQENRSPAWSADGRSLWMMSDRDGVPDEVYAAAIDANGAAGSFERVGLVAESVSLSASGLAYSAPARRANIWSLPVAPRGGTDVAAATRVTSGNQLVETLSVSPDGRWLLFDSDARGNADIYRLSLRDSVREQLTSDPRPEFTPSLSPDGRQLAWQRWVSGKRRVFVKALDGASAESVLSVNEDHGSPHWSPDGTALAMWSHETEAGVAFILRRDATGRWQPPRWRLRDAQLPVWSPDGRALAFVTFAGAIRTIPADSGAQRELYAPRPDSDDPIATYLFWGRDPQGLWFLGHVRSGWNAIWRLDPGTRRPRLVANLADPLGRTPGPVIASDGVRFYFTLDERSSNIRWAEFRRR